MSCRDEGGPRLEHQLRHLGVIADGMLFTLRPAGLFSASSTKFCNFSYLVRRASHPHPGLDRNGWMEGHVARIQQNVPCQDYPQLWARLRFQ